ncbi:MAG: glycosyl hydrolase, partial [Acidobacteria bacterium]|nr:glycosyl hydrolase [Acidobacteriota bacterium]
MKPFRPIRQNGTRLVAAILGVLTLSLAGGGAVPELLVQDTPAPQALRLVAGGAAAPIAVDSQDYAGVRRAAGDLVEDVARVTGVRPRLVEDQVSGARDIVVVGTLGRSRAIDRLVRAGKLDVREIRGRWESSIVQVVARPWSGVDRALVIAGSDKRGTIFGIYDMSERIGVSPWYWWADVPVRHRDQLFVAAGRHVRGEPAVRYRGIFINDEAPALSGWT